jgi:hypothetical protein
MRAITKVFKYFKGVFKQDSFELRQEARDASTAHYNNQPIQFRTVDNIIAFRRAYRNAKSRNRNLTVK